MTEQDRARLAGHLRATGGFTRRDHEILASAKPLTTSLGDQLATAVRDRFRAVPADKRRAFAVSPLGRATLGTRVIA